MNRLIALAAAAGSCFMLFACAAQAPPAPPLGLVVSNVTVVSPERAQPLEHAFVRIIDGKIAELSERPLRGQTEIDGKGRYLIPGLIDSHVHLAVPPGFPPGMTAARAAAHPDIVAATLAQDPRSYLFYGFTTLIDLVGSGQRTAQWNALEVRPDAYFCGAAVIMDHQIRFMNFPGHSYDVTQDQRIPPVVDPAQHTPEAVVARMAAEGAICVKTFYERVAGVTPTAEELRAFVRAAHDREMLLFIHATQAEAQGVAVEAGVDMIAHTMWRDPGALTNEAREILASVARDDIGYQPTLQLNVSNLDKLHDALDHDYLARADLADVYPAALIDYYASEEYASGQRGGIEEMVREPEFSVDAARTYMRGPIDRAFEVTRVLAESNARLVFGSDTPSDMTYTNPPGLNGRQEMNNWIAAGASEQKLFRALTIDNARMLRLDDRIGTVEPGKTANLLLLRADPLRSVKAYDTIETVFLHGRPIPRAELSARKLPMSVGAAEKSTTIINDIAYTKPQKLITIESGRKLNIYCTGKGSPTVVFDSGLGDGTRAWGLVQPAIAKHTRACSYDRAGLGFSDPPARPSTSANIVDDLHHLLHAGHVEPPYVLVGHSLGGMNIKLFAETYQSEIAGLVFVDPSHEDLGKGAWTIDPESQKTYAPYMQILHRCLQAKPEDFVAGSELVQNCGPFPTPRYSAAINAVELERGKQHGRLQARVSEQENVWFTSADQVRAAYRPLGTIPLIVLTHEPSPRGPSETQEQRDAKNKLWIDLHDQIAAMSARGRRLTVEHAGHYIQLDQPQTVIDSIVEVLRDSDQRSLTVH